MASTEAGWGRRRDTNVHDRLMTFETQRAVLNVHVEYKMFRDTFQWPTTRVRLFT